MNGVDPDPRRTFLGHASIPWAYRRNPINGVQFSQQHNKMAYASPDGASRNEAAGRLNDKQVARTTQQIGTGPSTKKMSVVAKSSASRQFSSTSKLPSLTLGELPFTGKKLNKFSFNNFLLSGQPEVELYRSPKEKSNRVRSTKVVEQALQEFKTKLKDQVEQQVEDCDQHNQQLMQLKQMDRDDQQFRQ